MKQKYCLQSVVPFRSINQSPINNSKAKQTFSFCKSPRFATINPTCPIVSYGGDGIKRKDSGASIGYGKKYDLAQDAPESPSCHQYRLKTEFDENKHKKRGYSLKFSREQLIANSYIDHQVLKNPGVGKYQIEKKRTMPAFSIHQKTKVIDKLYSIEPQNNNPGAAHYYNNPEEHAKRFKCVTYTNSKSKRFPNFDNRLPGPGQYQSSNFSKIGKFMITINNGGSIVFDHSKRETQFDEAKKKSQKMPGPGAYRLASQFGQYDGDVYGRLDLSSSRTKKS